MGARLTGEPLAQQRPRPHHDVDRPLRLQGIERGQRRRHRHRGEPEGAGREHARRRVPERVPPDQSGQGVAVGEGLAEGGEVGADAERLPAPPQVEPEARAHVVEDERGAPPVAEGADAPREGGVDQRLVVAGVVTERRDENGGEVAPRLVGGGLHAREIVVGERQEVGFHRVDHSIIRVL